jgi:predicted AlkP superfamily phosphohydrolase/phosphomutase
LSAAPKVLVVGFDATEYRLVEEWSRSGQLQNLQSLRARGVRGRLRGPVAMGDDAAWASFYTGVSPGRHGRYFFHLLRPGSYKSPFWSDQDLRAEPFWDVLSRRGRRIALVDVPKSPLSGEINGLQLADWRVHGRDHATTCSNPPELATAVLARFGDDEMDQLGPVPGTCQHGYKPDFDYAGFSARLLRGVDQKTTLTTELLAREPWDLFAVVFKEGHCAGHKMWHLQDPDHHVHPGAGNGADADALKRIYQALDRALGTLLAQAGPETTVIVFSDLGMSSNFTGMHLFERVLLRLDMARRDWKGRLRLAAGRASLAVGTRLLRRDSENQGRRIRLFYDVIHGEQAAGIRFNVVGRETSGLVRPGAELQAHVEWLESALLGLEDPDSGRRLVRKVVRADDAFPGEHRDRLPDLLVVWDRSAPIFAVRSPLVGTLRAPDPRLRTGGHIDDGWFVAAGPAVAPGREGAVEDAALVDLAPTIAALLGEALPGVDGQPLRAISPP